MEKLTENMLRFAESKLGSTSPVLALAEFRPNIQMVKSQHYG